MTVILAIALLASTPVSAQGLPRFSYQESPLTLEDLIEDPATGTFAIKTSGVYGQPVILWHPDSSEADAIYLMPEEGSEPLAFSRDGGFIAVSHSRHGLRLYRTDKGTLHSENLSITAGRGTFSPDSSLLLLSNAVEDGTRHDLLLVTIPQLEAVASSQECPSNSIVWDPSNQYIAATDGYLLCAFAPFTLVPRWKTAILPPTLSELYTIPGRSAILAINHNTAAHVLDATDGTILGTIDASDIGVSMAYVHVGGDLALLAGHNGLALLDLNEMRYLEHFVGDTFLQAFGYEAVWRLTRNGYMILGNSADGSYSGGPIARVNWASYLNTTATTSTPSPTAHTAPPPAASTQAPTPEEFLRLARDGVPADLRAALQAGASVSISDDYGQTPLMYAAGANSPDALKALIQAGADVNARSAAGWTALMYAARDNPDDSVITLLIESGADPHITNQDRQTADDLASTAAARAALATDPPTRTVPISWAPDVAAELYINGERANDRQLELPVWRDTQIEVIPNDSSYTRTTITYRADASYEQEVIVQLERRPPTPAPAAAPAPQQNPPPAPASPSPTAPTTYSSASGRPAPPPGQKIQATPGYIVNFLANELELTILPCNSRAYDPLICGVTPDGRNVVEILVNALFELYLQPAHRAHGWQTEPDSGSYIAFFQRPEGIYGVSYNQGAVSIGYVGQ